MWIGARISKVSFFLHNCTISYPVGSIVDIDQNIER
jgi:hypothetical protein